MTLGERIRELREKKDISLRELARRLRKTPAFISDVELGRRNPSDEVLELIAQKLGTTVEDLRQYDSRAPLEEIRKLASGNPKYGFAFRQVIEEKLTPEDLLEAARKKREENDQDK